MAQGPPEPNTRWPFRYGRALCLQRLIRRPERNPKGYARSPAKNSQTYCLSRLTPRFDLRGVTFAAWRQLEPLLRGVAAPPGQQQEQGDAGCSGRGCSTYLSCHNAGDRLLKGGTDRISPLVRRSIGASLGMAGNASRLTRVVGSGRIGN